MLLFYWVSHRLEIQQIVIVINETDSQTMEALYDEVIAETSGEETDLST